MKGEQKIKIFGERNSGTNYLIRLIMANLQIRMLSGTVPNIKLFRFNEFTKNFYFTLSSNYNLGWKHACVEVEKIKLQRQVRMITISKNPYSFLLSLYKRPYHLIGEKADSFTAFLKQRWYLQKRDNINAEYLPSPIDLWNIKNRSYLNLKQALGENTVNLTYEALLADPEKVIKGIAEKFEVQNAAEFINIDQSTKREKNKTFVDYQRYYLEEEWKTQLTEEHITLINERLEEEVMDYFAYKKLLPVLGKQN